MHDLCEAVSVAAPKSDCIALAMSDSISSYSYPPIVQFELHEKDLSAYRKAADFLNFNKYDVLSIQHEFGIFGGPAGSHLLALLREVRMPVVTTLHTILRDPSEAQERVMQGLIERSDRLVVMAEKGLEILKETYGVDPEKVDVICHGIPDVHLTDSADYKAQFGVQGKQVLMTFGLLSPGKGIEYVIQALPEVLKDFPNVVYLVLGATHPTLLAKDGDLYRLRLERLAQDLGVKDNVIFYNRFVNDADLQEFVGATDIYITPYLNESQITSGTLAYVFGCGKAVLSTPFWHAKELLGSGAGILVPFRNASEIARGICKYLRQPELLRKTQESAYKMGRNMIWPAVANRYLDTFIRACADRRGNPRTAFADWTLASRPNELPTVQLDHVVNMTDSTGIFQHATYNVPNFHEGYCTDDNARAFLLCVLLENIGHPPMDLLTKLATRYLSFLTAAWNPEEMKFRNFMNHSRFWLETVGSEDSQGRALWALGTGAGRSQNDGHRKLCTQLFEQSLPMVDQFISPRSWAFALLGLSEYLHRVPQNQMAKDLRAVLIEKLLQRWRDSASDSWPWFEETVTYENVRLCQALIISGHEMNHSEALALGLSTLTWMIGVQRAPEGHFRPVGCNGFYTKLGDCAQFDQQPVEAQAMISATLEAYLATKDPKWLKEAKHVFEWFLGRNDLSLSLYDPATQGCSDGLHHDRVSHNQGAESTLAFHLSLAELHLVEFMNTHLTGPTQ